MRWAYEESARHRGVLTSMFNRRNMDFMSQDEAHRTFYVERIWEGQLQHFIEGLRRQWRCREGTRVLGIEGAVSMLVEILVKHPQADGTIQRITMEPNDIMGRAWAWMLAELERWRREWERDDA